MLTGEITNVKNISISPSIGACIYTATPHRFITDRSGAIEMHYEKHISSDQCKYRWRFYLIRFTINSLAVDLFVIQSSSTIDGYRDNKGKLIQVKFYKLVSNTQFK